jgi:hypothetical protein
VEWSRDRISFLFLKMDTMLCSLAVCGACQQLQRQPPSYEATHPTWRGLSVHGRPKTQVWSPPIEEAEEEEEVVERHFPSPPTPALFAIRAAEIEIRFRDTRALRGSNPQRKVKNAISKQYGAVFEGIGGGAIHFPGNCYAVVVRLDMIGIKFLNEMGLPLYMVAGYANT